MVKRFLLFIISICSYQLISSGYFIGAYANPYNVLNPIFNQSMPIEKALLEIVVPKKLLSAISTPELAQSQILFNISVFGKPIFGDVPDKTYNLVFHNQVRDWLPQKPVDFNKHSLMGIFEQIGATVQGVSSPIALDSLREENVHVHDNGEFYSPNNARFKIEPGAKIASFWSVVVAPDDKSNILVSLSIVVDDENFADKLGEILLSCGINSINDILSSKGLIEGMLLQSHGNNLETQAFLRSLDSLDVLAA